MILPAERLTWTTIAEPGRDDYVEEVIVQPGLSAEYLHQFQIPSRAQLSLPLPLRMRYTLTVTVNELSATRSVDFALLKSEQRPVTFPASDRGA